MENRYLNETLIGNSSMLATMDRFGKLLRIFWPHIDSRQLLDKYRLGIKIGSGSQTQDIFVSENIISQKYIAKTNIVKTDLYIKSYNININVTDHVHPSSDTITRMIKIKNKNDYQIAPWIVSYISMQGYGNDIACSMFDHETDAAVFYTKDHFMASGFDVGADDYFLGMDPIEQYLSSQLEGYDDIGMMPCVVIKKNLGILKPNETKNMIQYFCFAKDQKVLGNLTKKYLNTDKDKMFSDTKDHWIKYFDSLRKPDTDDSQIQKIYERSLLLFALMTDKKTGAILAAPEVDEGFTRCGRYAYCWIRDAVFITSAYDKCGLYDKTEKFFDWASSTQEADGSWHQRYCMNGALAPSWGFQIDETAGILYGLYEHWKTLKDDEIIIRHKDMIKKAADFLCLNKNKESKLHEICYDLWEERRGIHVYSCASIVSGLRAAVSMGKITGFFDKETVKWSDRSNEILEGIYKYFWKPEYRRFIRSIYVKNDSFGLEDTQDRIWLSINKKGTKKDFTPEDWKFDISLLGLSYPFECIKPSSVHMSDTFYFIEKTLKDASSGNYKRYEDDSYIGGNPWILATLWAGIFLFDAKRSDEAVLCLKNAVSGAGIHHYLPEQIDKKTNEPRWVIPLTWSHAMFILLIDRIYGFEQEKR